MIRFAPYALTVALALPIPALAQDAHVDAVIDAMGLDRIIHVMRLEGIAYGEDIGTDLLGGAPTGNWAAQVDQIYDEDRMMQMLHTELATELDGVDTDSIVAFFTSETGAKVVDLEIAAREALLDDAVEEASREAAIVAMADGDPRVVQVERFIHANDLIESNVVGAMNSNYAYFMGLLDGGALPGQMTEEQILSDVWAQEPDIRFNSTEWLYSFLLMAYAPLSDEELETYITFSESEVGQDINRALFAAFDQMFIDISRALGLASAEMMVVQDL